MHKSKETSMLSEAWLYDHTGKLVAKDQRTFNNIDELREYTQYQEQILGRKVVWVRTINGKKIGPEDEEWVKIKTNERG